MKPKGRTGLSAPQKALVAAYTNPAAETYLNGARSYVKAHPGADPKNAHTNACLSLQRPHVRAEIERILNAQGATPDESAHAIADIIKGTARSEVVQYDKEGNVVSRTVAAPRASDRIKAADLRFKVAGHYARQAALANAEADIAKEEYARLLRDTGLVDDTESPAPNRA